MNRWASPSTPAPTASSACAWVRACATTSRPRACAAPTSASTVSVISVGQGCPVVVPSSRTTFRKCEPSATRAATKSSACTGPATVGNGVSRPCVTSRVGCPPGAVAPMPAERRSAALGSEDACCTSAPTRPGSANMSSSVVTPDLSADCSAPGKTCACASIRPGRTVPPRASTTGTPAGGVNRGSSAATRPSRTSRHPRGWNRYPSKSFAPTIKTLSGTTVTPPFLLVPPGRSAHSPRAMSPHPRPDHLGARRTSPGRKDRMHPSHPPGTIRP